MGSPCSATVAVFSGIPKATLSEEKCYTFPQDVKAQASVTRSFSELHILFFPFVLILAQGHAC